MNYWLMKSEPTSFSIDTLSALPKHITAWDGVRNYQARNMMRDQMHLGDLAFFYHSNCKVPGIVGIVEVCSKPYADKTQFDLNSPYYDARALPDKPIWWLVDVKLKQKFSHIISLPDLRNHSSLSDLVILRKGNRLSITPIDQQQWRTILLMAG